MTASDLLEQLRVLYFGATQATIGDDVDRAIDLLKRLPSDDDREKAAVYMEGLVEMRSEWAPAKKSSSASGKRR